MKFTQLHFTLFVLFSLMLSACDNNPNEPDTELFTGILRTDANAKILGGDEGDFQPRPEVEPNSNPLKPLNNALYPAFPNPSKESIIIMYQIDEPDTVSIYLFDRPNSAPIDTLKNFFHRSQAVYALILENPGKEGIFRVTMETSGGFRSSGDVEFQN